jgi:hypothetical protein
LDLEKHILDSEALSDLIKSLEVLRNVGHLSTNASSLRILLEALIDLTLGISERIKVGIPLDDKANADLKEGKYQDVLGNLPMLQIPIETPKVILSQRFADFMREFSESISGLLNGTVHRGFMSRVAILAGRLEEAFLSKENDKLAKEVAAKRHLIKHFNKHPRVPKPFKDKPDPEGPIALPPITCEGNEAEFARLRKLSREDFLKEDLEARNLFRIRFAPWMSEGSVVKPKLDKETFSTPPSETTNRIDPKGRNDEVSNEHRHENDVHKGNEFR